MATIEQSVEVDVPVSVAYNQWTQFEEFPRFMEGVKEVRQRDDTHLEWKAEIGGQEHAWLAEVTRQEPDRLISWRSVDGQYNSGKVTFHPLTTDRTRIDVELTYDAEGLTEALGGALGFDSRRVGDDLRRFKEFIEARGTETGAWRDEVHPGGVTDR
jgi:uncharacterized membrane protein